MSELNTEQIIKALERCQTPLVSDCKVCGYEGKILDDGRYHGCVYCLMDDAIALIKQLTKEVENQKAFTEQYQRQFEEAKSDTVRKMAERLKERKVSYGNITFKVVPIDDIDKIAKEMFEDTK